MNAKGRCKFRLLVSVDLLDKAVSVGAHTHLLLDAALVLAALEGLHVLMHKTRLVLLPGLLRKPTLLLESHLPIEVSLGLQLPLMSLLLLLSLEGGLLLEGLLVEELVTADIVGCALLIG
jgi:hypothetical protein